MLDPILDAFKYKFLSGGDIDRYSFGKKIEEAKKQPSFYPISIQTPKSLQSLGIDLNETNEKMNQDIIKKKQNTKTQDDFETSFKNAKNSGEFNNVSDEELYVGMLTSYKNRGFTIEGIDIDKELALFAEPTEDIESTPTTPTIKDTEPQKEESKYFAKRVWDDTNVSNLAISGLKEARNILGGAIAEIPNIMGNTSGFVADVLTPKDYEGLGDFWRKKGISEKQGMQDLLGVDAEAFTTKAGEFGTDIGSLFIPGGQAKLIAKFPQAAEKINKLSKGLNVLAEKAPKVYNVLKSAAIGGGQAAKFDVIAEGEISPTSVAIGAAINPVFDKAGKVVSGFFGRDVESGLQKIIKPGTKQTQKEITKDMSIIAGSLKANKKNPQELGALYDDMHDIMQKLYTEKINPAIKEAMEKGATQGGGKINIAGLLDEAKTTTATKEKVIQGMSAKEIFLNTKDSKRLEAMIKRLNENFKELDLLEAEIFKQDTSAILTAVNQESVHSGLTSLEVKYIENLNRLLGNKIDDIISNLTGEGVKISKAEYGAFARHIDELNKRIIKDNNLTGVSLFDGLGKMTGLSNIAELNIKEGAVQLLIGDTIKKMRDPDEILKQTMKRIYRADKPQGVWPGVGSSISGREIDKFGTEKRSSNLDDSYLDDSYSNGYQLDDSYLED